MNPSQKRLFFALWPDDSVREDLLTWQRACTPSGARSTHRSDFHMTLHFLGQVPAGRVQDIVLTSRNIYFETFDIVLSELGHFSRPRVLWAGPGRTPEALLNLHGRIGKMLENLDFCPETRVYRPHVTLARKVDKLPQATDLKPISWHAKQWALVESVSGRRPLYEPLEIWSLGRK